MPSSIFTSSTSIFLQISPLYPTLTLFIPTCPTGPPHLQPPTTSPSSHRPLPQHRRRKGGAVEASRTGAGHPSLPPRSTRAGRRLSMELHAAGLKSRRRGSGGRSSSCSSPVSSSSPAVCTSGVGEGRAAPSSHGGPLSLHVPRRPNRGLVLVGRHQQLPAAGGRGARTPAHPRRFSAGDLPYRASPLTAWISGCGCGG
jgi:hypothetical protein